MSSRSARVGQDADTYEPEPDTPGREERSDADDAGTRPGGSTDAEPYEYEPL